MAARLTSDVCKSSGGGDEGVLIDEGGSGSGIGVGNMDGNEAGQLSKLLTAQVAYLFLVMRWLGPLINSISGPSWAVS